MPGELIKSMQFILRFSGRTLIYIFCAFIIFFFTAFLIRVFFIFFAEGEGVIKETIWGESVISGIVLDNGKKFYIEFIEDEAKKTGATFSKKKYSFIYYINGVEYNSISRLLFGTFFAATIVGGIISIFETYQGLRHKSR